MKKLRSQLSSLSLRQEPDSNADNHKSRKKGHLQVEKNIVMAKVIEFYIPANFQKRVTPIPDSGRGKLIEFCPTEKKSA